LSNVFPFPKNNDRFGAVHTKRLNITCADCGNTERFYGTAQTQPFIIIEKHGDHHYDVSEVGYRNNGSVDETIESCASCGSRNIQVEVLQKGVQ